MVWHGTQTYTFLHVHTFSHFTCSHVARTLELGCGWGVGYGMAWDSDLHISTRSHIFTFHMFTRGSHIRVRVWVGCELWYGMGLRLTHFYTFTHFHISHVHTWLAH